MVFIFSLAIRWNNDRSHPFVNDEIPVSDDDAKNTSGFDFIRAEVLKKSPAAVYADNNITSATSSKGGSNPGRNYSRLLHLPIGTILDRLSKHDPSMELNVVIDRDSPSTSAANKCNKKSALDMLMAKSKPGVGEFSSEWCVSKVRTFLDGYYEAASKERYLKSFTKLAKPSIVQQIEAFVVEFLHDEEITYNTGTGGEESRAKQALKESCNVFKFVHEHRHILEAGQSMRFGTPLLTAMELAISSKVNKSAKPKSIGFDIANEELKNAEAALGSWPSSYSTKNSPSGVRYGEPIFKEIKNCSRIIGHYLVSLEKQSARNELFAVPSEKDEWDIRFNVATKIITTPFKRKATCRQSFRERARYSYLDKLEKLLGNLKPYELLDLTDDVIGVNKEKFPSKAQRNKERSAFVSIIGFKQFPVGFFELERNGSWSNWRVVFKMENGHDEKHPNFVQAIARASQESPSLLSRQQTSDALNTIAFATGTNKRTCKALLNAILPDGSYPSFAHKAAEDEFVTDVTKCIMCADGNGEFDMVTDMRDHNIRGNTDASRHAMFSEAANRVIELESGTGAHHRRHAAADEETTQNVSYSPGINSIPLLIRKTKDLLEKEGKVAGVDFEVPSETWVRTQLSPNHEHRKTAAKYREGIKVKFQLMRKSERDRSHPASHWVAAHKRNWRYHTSHLTRLWNKYLENASDDTVPVVPAIEAIKVFGADDKSGIPVGRDVPVAATSSRSVRALVPQSIELLAGDHDFSCDKVTTSVVHDCNVSENPGDSLYSGGEDGNGNTYVSLHDAILDPSTGLKHAAQLNKLLLMLARKFYSSEDDSIKPTPHLLHLETDGGPDHNLTFLSNQLVLFGVFLVSNCDKMNATRGCPGMSWMLTAERPMSLLTLGLSCLSLRLCPQRPEWLDELLKNASSMKAVRKSIEEYDNDVGLAIVTLEKRLATLAQEDSVTVEESSDSIEPSDELQVREFSTFKVGDKINRFFPGCGWYEGEITHINPNAEDGKIFHIDYWDDDDREDVTLDELRVFAAEAGVPIGEVGYKFIREFRGAGFYSGTVVKVQNSGKRKCKFNDGAIHSYTLEEIEEYSKNRFDWRGSGGDNERGGEDDDDSLDENDNENEQLIYANGDDCQDMDVGDEALSDDEQAAAPSPTTEDAEERAATGRFYKKLIILPEGASLEDHTNDLKNRRSARDEYSKAIEYPKSIVEKRFSNLELSGRPVVVFPYADSNDCNLITDALKKFDEMYDPSFRSKSQLSKMPNIKAFFESSSHCRITPFSVEFRLCGKSNCSLCALVGRNVRTPDEEVDGFNLRTEVLRYMDPPVAEPKNSPHFLAPSECRSYIDRHRSPIESLLTFLPDSKLDSEEKKERAKRAKEDKARSFRATQVRAVAHCDNCGASRCIFSVNAVGSKKGPTKEQGKQLEAWLENGYHCGNDLVVDGAFYVQRKLSCGDFIESQFYMPNSGTRGGRVMTQNICSICYDTEDIVSPSEIRKKRNVGGKNPLMVCRFCFDSKLPIPTSGGRSNFKQKEMQERNEKRQSLNEAVKQGRRVRRRG